MVDVFVDAEMFVQILETSKILDTFSIENEILCNQDKGYILLLLIFMQKSVKKWIKPKNIYDLFLIF